MRNKSSREGKARKITDCARNSILLAVLLVALALLVLPATSQTGWEQATADKLARFLPTPVEGLTAAFPWDSKDFNKVEPLYWGGWSRDEIPYDPDYAPAGVVQHWRIADPKFLEQVKRAEKESADSQAAMMRGEAPVQEDPGMERKLQELEKKMERATEADNMAEVMRLQKEFQKISASASQQSSRVVETVDRPKKLKEVARELRMVIEANLMPRGADVWSAEVKSKSGNRRNPVPPAATIQSYPVGRNPQSLNGGISYTIYLGPPGIDAGQPGGGPYMRKEVKALFVMVEVKTDPEHQTADEALALGMLEKVDYTGLTKLLVP